MKVDVTADDWAADRQPTVCCGLIDLQVLTKNGASRFNHYGAITKKEWNLQSWYLNKRSRTWTICLKFGSSLILLPARIMRV